MTIISDLFHMVCTIVVALVVYVLDPRNTVVRYDEIVLNGEETYWERRVNGPPNCRQTRVFVQVGRLQVHTPWEPCSRDWE